MELDFGTETELEDLEEEEEELDVAALDEVEVGVEDLEVESEIELVDLLELEVDKVLLEVLLVLAIVVLKDVDESLDVEVEVIDKLELAGTVLLVLVKALKVGIIDNNPIKVVAICMRISLTGHLKIIIVVLNYT